MIRTWITVGLLGGVTGVTACHVPVGSPPATLVLPRTPLTQPQGLDWSSHTIAGAGLGALREAHLARRARRSSSTGVALGGLPTFRLAAAWPAVSGEAWSVSGPGLPVAGVADSGADHIPNALATGWYGDTNHRYLFALSENGRLLRLERDAVDHGAAGAAAVVNLGDTFTRTMVSMSPACTRAYLLSDAGRLHVVDTGTMRELPPGGIALGAGGRYLAPMVDPVLSELQDTRDVLFVPTNDGIVHQLRMEAGATAPVLVADHAVAVDAVTLAPAACEGCEDYVGLKFGAPGVAIKGRVIIGDTAGVLHDFDTASGKHDRYPVSTHAPIAAPPAVEVQNNSGGTRNLVTGAFVRPSPFEPVETWVMVTRDAGPVCAWVKLASQDILYSQPLFVDDAEVAGTKPAFGALLDYQRDVAASGVFEVAMTGSDGDAVTLVRSASPTIPGTTSETSASPLAASVSGGGGTTIHMRVRTGGLPDGARILAAQLRLTHQAGGASVIPPRLSRTGGGGGEGSTGRTPRGAPTTLWSSLGTPKLSRSTEPMYAGQTYETALQGWGGWSPAEFSGGAAVNWDASGVLVGPVRVNHQSFSLGYNWTQYVPYGSGAVGESARFDGSSDPNPPLLRLTYEVPRRIPIVPAETGPLYDATRKRVYAQHANYVFALNSNLYFDWTDTLRSPYSNWYSATTSYQATALGLTTGARDDLAGGAYVRNQTTLAPAFDFSAIYALSQGRRAGGGYDVALSKLRPNPSASARAFGDSQRALDLAPGKGVSTVIAGSLTEGGDPLASPRASNFLLVDPFDQLMTKGGDVYVGLADTGRLYRIATDD